MILVWALHAEFSLNYSFGGLWKNVIVFITLKQKTGTDALIIGICWHHSLYTQGDTSVLELFRPYPDSLAASLCLWTYPISNFLIGPCFPLSVALLSKVEYIIWEYFTITIGSRSHPSLSDSSLTDYLLELSKMPPQPT